MNSHQTPEPVYFPYGLAVDTEAGLGQPLLEFVAAERMLMGVLGPRQNAIQHSHARVISTPVCDDQITVR